MQGMTDADLRMVLVDLMGALMESQPKLAPTMQDLIKRLNLGEDVRKVLVAITGELQKRATGDVQKLARTISDLIIKRLDVGEDVRTELGAIAEDLRRQERERTRG